ncbi:MAG: type I 3-dehydroquinate dehydratase [Spirochaetaceae bacterium]|jgi:3-dehydroquinate dehydratase/shikimate dehydrogenase|nr:type I 3-dehydroquinate dehydratase [Spirochaetaceae bacterium]
MAIPKICLCAAGSTINADLAMVEQYRRYIDLVELRADCLTENERLHIRKFPELAGLPCILTIRRQVDGGAYIGGEAHRTILFAKAMAFANQDRSKNFAYVDFEEDFYVPSLQEAALAFDTRIIRSYHNLNECVTNIAAKINSLKITGYEIAKIACTPRNLHEVSTFFAEAMALSRGDYILCLMGEYGFPSRILAERLQSFLTFSSPADGIPQPLGAPDLDHVDPITLHDMYGIKRITRNTKIFGIAGYPLKSTLSPLFHNTAFRKHNLDAVYIPIRGKEYGEVKEFAGFIGMSGLSITVPHKESAFANLKLQSESVKQVGACNTLLRTAEGWVGYDTDGIGMVRALQDFLEKKTLSGLRVSIIGAGGAAKAVAWAVCKLHGKACVFNRTAARAKKLAGLYKFRFASLGPESIRLLGEYNDLIIQATSVGLDAVQAGPGTDPLYFYLFNGKEAVYDIIYTPELTPLLARAQSAGCRISNGRSMLHYQAYEQFKLFTGETY